MGRVPVSAKGIANMAIEIRFDRGGFTLMEIVIAVAIVAIFAAATQPDGRSSTSKTPS